MIYERRTYEAAPGKLRTLVDQFGSITDGLLKKHGMRPVGYWTEAIGDSTKLHYMLAWEDDAKRVTKWAAFRNYPERIRSFAEAEKDGPFVTKTNTIWQPTAFSALG